MSFGGSDDVVPFVNFSKKIFGLLLRVFLSKRKKIAT